MKAKTHLSQNKSRGGFTLVEMLVVIGMIATLAGISFPVYRSIQKKVEKQKFEIILTSLDRAVDNFETEYNYLPYVGAAYPGADSAYYSGSDSDFLGVLMGLGGEANFKGITFFECEEAKGSPPKSGVVDNGDGSATLYNAGGWELWYRLDHNMDGEIAHPCYSGSTGTMLIGFKLAVYAPGAEDEVRWPPTDTWTTNFPWPVN